MNTRRFSRWLFVAMSVVFISCSQALYFDQHSYNNIESVQLDAFTLLDKANQPYEQHKESVEALKSKIDNIISYEEAKGKFNAPVVNMWKTVRTSSGNLISVFNLWEAQGTLSNIFIAESKPRIAEMLNSIKIVEDHKSKK